MKENFSKKPKYEAPVVLAIGDLPVGTGQEGGTCIEGSSAASGCSNGDFAADMRGWPKAACTSGFIASGGNNAFQGNECNVGTQVTN
jgi:hypothetical protein